MKPINGWNEVQELGGAIENLPAGAYVCEIKKCEEKPNRNGGSRLEISFDVCEGDYRGWFMQDWRSQNREDKFWRGIVNQNVPNEDSPKYDMQCRFFKRFISNIEESNPGYHWDWNEANLKDKKIGVVFGEVERESQTGTRYMITRADSLIKVDDVRNGKFKIPAPRMLEGSPSVASAPASVDADIPMDDVPF